MDENPDTLKAGFRRIKAEAGLGRAQVLKAYARYTPDVGHKMLLSEYMALDLYQHDAIPGGYIGTRAAAEFARDINFQKHKRGLVDDKLLFDGALRGLGFPVAEVQAIFGAKHLPPPIHSLADRQAIASFLERKARYPLFGKPLSGQNSKDVIAIDRCAGNILHLSNGESMELPAFLNMIAPKHARWGYLFQTRIDQHPEISLAIGATVGTLRIVTFLRGAEARIIGALWKIPRFGMMADNLWRGGLLASVDLQTGIVGRALDGIGPAADWHDTHPDTGAALTGRLIPNWRVTADYTIRAAGLLSGLPLVGWDIAIGPDGPVFIEANTSPSLDLLQYPARLPALPRDLRLAIEAEAARLRGQVDKDRTVRKQHLRSKIRARLRKSIGIGSSKP